jgi:hypothetical protein
MVWKEMKKLIAAAWLAIVVPALAAPEPPPHVYNATALKAVRKIGNDLFDTLDEKYQKKVDPDMIRLGLVDAPVITPVPGDDENKALNQIFISVGFIDLINHIAHARAIDRIQPGYFAQYVLNLAHDKGTDAPPEPPDMVDNRYWNDEVMNDQITYFNQILSMTMAISLAHSYLGHFAKYSNQMLAGKLVPITTFLAPAEWESSLKAATLNSLNCAEGTDGLKSLFEAIDKMPQRPAWTAFIVPPSVDLKKVNKELAKYEKDYFHGGLK